MFLLVPAHLGCPGQIPQSRKTVVCCVCVCVVCVLLACAYIGEIMIFSHNLSASHLYSGIACISYMYCPIICLPESGVLLKWLMHHEAIKIAWTFLFKIYWANFIEITNTCSVGNFLKLAHCSLSIEHKRYWNRPVAHPICWSCACMSVWKVYCGKTAEWIRMPFGVVSGVGLGICVLDGFCKQVILS